MRRSLERLGGILEEARSVSRKRAKRADLVPIIQVIRDVVHDARDLHPSTRVSLTVEPRAEAAHVPLQGGAAAFSRVVSNLVLNAIQGDGKSSASGVDVFATVVGRQFLLVVEDDGPGFSRQVLEAPPEAISTTKDRGSGLGIYTAHRILEASGGTLERANQEGSSGACVTVTLPLETEEA
jgi:signal transduction histidine kinase